MVGITGTVYSWFESYLTGRDFIVSVNDTSSGRHGLTCGVPQGSVLGPTLFNLYMLPLGDVIRRHGINFHSYADDTQLYVAVSPDDMGPIDDLLSCVLDIETWMGETFLKLNQDKTDILIVGPEAERERVQSYLSTFNLNVCNKVKNLGVILDADLNFEAHANQVTKTAFYHLRNIARVRPFLSQASAEILIHAFITSRINYCNALLSGAKRNTINRLQLVQNSAARLLTRTRKKEHITPILKSLHWLPVSFRIDFKVLLLVYKSLHGTGPSFLSDLLLVYDPPRALRSTGAGLLVVPKVRTKTHGEAFFQHCGPRLWNSLPEDVRASATVEVFKKKLKTHLFSKAFT
uniref:Reverse transcriptase domain-containing protein n=1 Tax=Oryzias latipes TaxID=8090 RepID=A0A3P9IWS2_ORYLA